MATKLTAGERQVYTTASSLASRMGVVKAHTGDPIALATETISGTINLLAKQKLSREEENWKNNLKANALKSFLKFSKNNRYNPAEFMNVATGYETSMVDAAPEKFKAWTKAYMATLITQHSSTIIDNAFVRESKESKDSMLLANNAELDDIQDVLMNSHWEEHTGLFSTNIVPRLSEMVKSYTTIYNSVPNSLRNDMDKPEDYMRNLKINLEETRQLSIWNGLLDAAFKEDNENIANGVLVGDEVTGWEGKSASDDALTKIIGSMYEYMESGINYKDGPRPVDGPFSFVDLNKTERTVLADEVIKQTTARHEQFKNETASLTNSKKSDLSMLIQELQSGKQNSINDTFNSLGLNNINDVKGWIDTNLVGASTDQMDKLIESWQISKSVQENAMRIFLPISPKKMGDEPGLTVEGAINAIKQDIGHIEGSEDNNLIEGMVADHILGMYLMASTGSPYLDLSKVGFIKTEDGVIGPSNELVAMGNLATQHGYVHNDLINFLNGAQRIDAVQNPDAIINMANIVKYINDKAGMQPSNVDVALWVPLLQLSERMDLMSKTGTEGEVMSKTNILEMYTMHVNPSKTDLDEKLNAIEGSFAKLQERDIELKDIIRSKLEKEIKKQAGRDTFWLSKGMSAIQEWLDFMLPGRQDQPLKGMVPTHPMDQEFFIDQTMPFFEELVKQHLAFHFVQLGDILPSSVNKALPDAIISAFHELGNKGFKFEGIQ